LFALSHEHVYVEPEKGDLSAGHEGGGASGGCAGGGDAQRPHASLQLVRTMDPMLLVDLQ
jgi:hypothetical protein